MIFSDNHTSLGSVIPMAEGYDCAYGSALALVEGARNDYEMFKAMLSADYQEISMEHNGYTNESVTALHESVGAGIFKKIAELIKKLIAKLKAIVHTFVAKMNSIFMKDADLVKKYEKEVIKKTNIGNLEVKWRKVKPTKEPSISGKFTTVDGLVKLYKNDKDEQYETVLKEFGIASVDWDDFANTFTSLYLEDEDTVKISDIGGVRQIISTINNNKKATVDLEKKIKSYTAEYDKLVKNADREYDNAAKNAVNDAKDQSTVDDARKAYDVAQVLQQVAVRVADGEIEVNKKKYQQARAAFVKAISANDKKLAENAIYLNAVAEAAEEEVDEVINTALSDEEISDLSAADTTVIGSGVSDDSEELVYDKVQKYSSDACMGCSDGSVEADIQGSTEESAFFGKLLY